MIVVNLVNNSNEKNNAPLFAASDLLFKLFH